MNMFEMVSIKQDGHRKKLIVLASLVSFLMIFLVSVSVFKTQPAKSHISTVSRASASFPCQNTLYPDVCQSLVLSSTNDGITPSTTGDMFDLSLKFTVNQVHSIRSLVYNITSRNQKSNTDSALNDCLHLLDHSLHQLSKIQNNHKATWSSDDIQTWLSAAITHQTTCLDSLQSDNTLKKNDVFYSSLENNIQHISNSLALHKSTVLTKESGTLKGSGGRKLLSNDFPSWVSHGERRLLEASVNELKPHAVVSADGTGTHKTISEAIAFVSLAGSGRNIIHVKAGTYSESSLNVPLKQSNIMLVGDGKGVTVITGSKSAGGGSTTFNSATFGVSGDGFIARDITFVNSAGPAKGQAVALRVSSDKSVFYRCSMVGYQDTLYTLSNRQFYRECDISGTVDFIFGNSAVVFQGCNIMGRGNGKNYITAQGRSDPNQNTGISIHKCKVSGQSTTYLGRPWKQHSRTVYMQSSLDGSINPAGWFPWSGSSYLNTLYYGEYMNTGSGASTSGRVKWGGVHSSMSSSEASKFTVGSLIAGDSWLPSTGIIYEN